MIAEIYGHPSFLTTPQAFDRLEEETGLKAIIVGHSIKCVPQDDYDIVAAQDWLGKIGAFPGRAA